MKRIFALCWCISLLLLLGCQPQKKVPSHLFDRHVFSGNIEVAIFWEKESYTHMEEIRMRTVLLYTGDAASITVGYRPPIVTLSIRGQTYAADGSHFKLIMSQMQARRSLTLVRNIPLDIPFSTPDGFTDDSAPDYLDYVTENGYRLPAGDYILEATLILLPEDTASAEWVVNGSFSRSFTIGEATVD
ncbi:hypothetical protein LJC20_01770 [Eubacteriales bacterium OttesenSCG-928-M02]|nr:hypothetical protein [Eubacteriales bacterium OttesenSCG-928-M02]